MKACFITVLSVLALIATNPARAETAEQWIAKARAYLGSESALNAVSTIHYKGTIEMLELAPASDDKTRSTGHLESFPVEIIFQKPYQQLMTVIRPHSIDTMVLDDYDGWSRSIDRQNPKQWRLTLLDAGQIKQLRANTSENINFFSGLEKKGGSVELGEDVTIDGVACAKLSFIYSERIFFRRYFDRTTGRLVKTETANGSEIREEGEIIVNGIRFPQKIINKASAGAATTITFTAVVLNERIPATEFAVPSLRVE